MFTEFGACWGETACSTEIEQVTSIADGYLAGWAYWQFKDFQDITTTAYDKAEGFYENDGTLQEWKVRALARTYAQRTQGTPTEVNFNNDNGHFSYTFKVNTGIEAPTVLYMSEEYWYPAGFDISIKSSGQIIDSTAYEQSTDGNFTEIKIIDTDLNHTKLTI